MIYREERRGREPSVGRTVPLRRLYDKSLGGRDKGASTLIVWMDWPAAQSSVFGCTCEAKGTQDLQIGASTGTRGRH